MKRNGNSLIKDGLYYFLRIQINVVLTMLLSLVTVIPVRMIIYEEYTRDLLIGIFSLLIESAALCFLFKKEEETNKYTLGRFLLPLTVAVPIHFLLGLLTGFYPITTGLPLATFAEMIWASVTENELLNVAIGEVPLYIRILLFLGLLAVKLGAILLGYALAKQKHITHETKPESI